MPPGTSARATGASPDYTIAAVLLLLSSSLPDAQHSTHCLHWLLWGTVLSSPSQEGSGMVGLHQDKVILTELRRTGRWDNDITHHLSSSSVDDGKTEVVVLYS